MLVGFDDNDDDDDDDGGGGFWSSAYAAVHAPWLSLHVILDGIRPGLSWPRPDRSRSFAEPARLLAAHSPTGSAPCATALAAACTIVAGELAPPDGSADGIAARGSGWSMKIGKGGGGNLCQGNDTPDSNSPACGTLYVRVTPVSHARE